MAVRGRPGRGGGDQGAAAVEFALILPLIFVLLMGIINYGLWFSDSISVRQGVRESARRVATVRTAAVGCAGTGMSAVACHTRSQIQEPGTLAYAKVWVANAAGVQTETWIRGQAVVVCGMVKATTFTGFAPLPAGGLIKSKTVMSIENVTPLPTDFKHEDPPPTGGDWTWCTA